MERKKSYIKHTHIQQMQVSQFRSLLMLIEQKSILQKRVSMMTQTTNKQSKPSPFNIIEYEN